MKKTIPLLLTLLTLILCLALAATAVLTYREGLARRAASGAATEPIFTRDIAATRLKALLPVTLLWLAGLMAALAAGAHPEDKPVTDNALAARLLRARRESTPDARREADIRRRVHGICRGLAALCAVPALACLLNRAHFTDWDLETVMGALLTRLLPWLSLALAALLADAALTERSLRRELVALKTAPGAEARRIPLTGTRPTGPIRALRWALFGVAAALIALGVQNGGLNDVLVKAINICTECIGLG